MAKQLNIKEGRRDLKPVNTAPAQTAPSVNHEVVYQSAFDALSYFTPENAPATYDGLKKEVKALEQIHSQSFFILAHRLKLIRDNELYREDGYEDFKTFVENELDITRMTVYNYIRVLEIFGVKPVLHEEALNYSSLLKIAPYAEAHPEDKDELLDKAKELSRRKLELWLKEHYQIVPATSKVQAIALDSKKGWYETEEEVLEHSTIGRKNMKTDTLKEAIRVYSNILATRDKHNPKVNDLKNIVLSLED